ncbi:MAG: type I restriction endonuclease subunit R [Formosimonas sp.]
MTYTEEAAFESALIHRLTHKGWESAILKNPTEADLLENWKSILFANNKGIDQLNNVPMTDGEMQQILAQINALKSPLQLNGLINGKSVTITRDNPADALHFGKQVSLKIYDRHEIAAGQSRYQIAQQPKFTTHSPMLGHRRGDVLLLINGMPVIHLELKRSGVDVSQACYQIEKYAHEGVFTGLFALVQVFVAMTPEQTVYFANPGEAGTFNKDYYFHWADINNHPIHHWQGIAEHLLSIPMAHTLIGFYTVADHNDGVLKVMRSYQYYAARAISDRVATTDWRAPNTRGGYVWHTTGSGKTMTSFKSAQLIAESQNADKVIFLMDRIELGTQSLLQYRGFAHGDQSVQATEDTHALVTKLKSNNPADAIIVTSIQKMSNIQADEGGLNAHDIEQMRGKRMVIIVDEAHRTALSGGTMTSEGMLPIIKATFPKAVLFGFTGTPILEENQKYSGVTQATVFGNELHRYSIADGIRDGNVLGFDPYMVQTYRERDIRKAVALQEAKAQTIEEALSDPAKAKIYQQFTQNAQTKMAGEVDKAGQYIKGVEDYLNAAQYQRVEHQEAVVNDMLAHWVQYSHNHKFHAIFATSSIGEAIAYYRLFKAKSPSLKVTALFDPNIDNNAGFAFKEEGLVEILTDYNQRYAQTFTLANHAQFKKDISWRMSHTEMYKRIAQTPELQIDVLIVVDQMLTGFDSKWVNTLYLDKRMEYANIIQAFSRTNRLFGHEKPFGTIRYYRYPHTMRRNIEAAVKLYSGDQPAGLFVEHLDANLGKMNQAFDEIKRLFDLAGVEYFEKLPADPAECGQFAKLFKQLNAALEAAKIQGFRWNLLTYEFSNGQGKVKTVVDLNFDEHIYIVLVQRYKELFAEGSSGAGGNGGVPFEIETYITEIDTGLIDSAYLDSRFKKFVKSVEDDGFDSERSQATLNDLHQAFASLSQEQQKFASIFLHDVQRGEVQWVDGLTFMDYISRYMARAQNDQIHSVATALGLDEQKLRTMIELGVHAQNINDFGRFDALIDTVNRAQAKKFFEQRESRTLKPFEVNQRIDRFLRVLIVSGQNKEPFFE